jgi:hypothetical protein
MRHDLAAGPIPTCSVGMREAAWAARLIAFACSALRSPPRPPRATAAAVDLAPVAAATQHDLYATQPAQVHPACLGHRRSGHKPKREWTPSATSAILFIALVRSSAHRVGAASGQTSRFGPTPRLFPFGSADCPGNPARCGQSSSATASLPAHAKRPPRDPASAPSHYSDREHPARALPRTAANSRGFT